MIETIIRNKSFSAKPALLKIIFKIDHYVLVVIVTNPTNFIETKMIGTIC